MERFYEAHPEQSEQNPIRSEGEGEEGQDFDALLDGNPTRRDAGDEPGTDGRVSRKNCQATGFRMALTYYMYVHPTLNLYFS